MSRGDYASGLIKKEISNEKNKTPTYPDKSGSIICEVFGTLWTFNPSTLTIGDNKIFVRMRSNASCIVSSTVIDSILLIRSSVTGITDPDAPGQVINIYPNPFEDLIIINGLNPSKSYIILLSNVEGKVLQTLHVTRRLSLSIHGERYARGIYLLSIYDEKRKQILGTVKMIRN